MRSVLPASENLHISGREQAQQGCALGFDYSITSSAVICIISGTVRPSALAVLRLMTNSNLVGCWTGNRKAWRPPECGRHTRRPGDRRRQCSPSS